MTNTTEAVTWVLTDWYGSQYGDHEYPKIPIHSAEQLRAVLEAFSPKESRLLNLESSGGFCVGLALGGPLGVVQLHRPVQQSLIAMTDEPHTNEEHCFVGDWEPSYYFPRHLLPVQYVIALAIEAFQTQQPPKWVKWEQCAEWQRVRPARAVVAGADEVIAG